MRVVAEGEAGVAAGHRPAGPSRSVMRWTWKTEVASELRVEFIRAIIVLDPGNPLLQ